MYDEESSQWKIPTVTRHVTKAALYLGGRSGGDEELNRVPVSLPRISIAEST
jgi:hypothetical protein